VRREAGKDQVVQVHCNEGVAIRIGPEPCAGIDEPDVPTRNATSSDFERQKRVVDCIHHVDVARPLHRQIASQDEGHLGLDPGLPLEAHGHGLGAAKDHAIEEQAEVGLVDAESGLHRPDRQSDLAAHDAPALVVQAMLGIEVLDGVGVCGVVPGEALCQWGDQFARLRCLAHAASRVGKIHR
jgi:hypothetical protein